MLGRHCLALSVPSIHLSDEWGGHGVGRGETQCAQRAQVKWSHGQCKPKIVAFLAHGVKKEIVERLHSTFGSDVATSVMDTGSFGLPLLGSYSIHFVRVNNACLVPSDFLRSARLTAVIPMHILLEQVDEKLAAGWMELWQGHGKPTTSTTNVRTVVDELTKTGVMPHGFDVSLLPEGMHTAFSEKHLKKAVALAGWASKMDGASTDLDDTKSPFYIGGALSETSGLKVYMSSHSRVVIMSPYHTLAVRGHTLESVNLSLVPRATSQLMACKIPPSTVALACILACQRAVARP